MEGVYCRDLMELYRKQGEEKLSGNTSNPASPTNGGGVTNGFSFDLSIPQTDKGSPIPQLYLHRPNGKLPPHVYQTADDAYRAMMRGMDMEKFLKRNKGGGSSNRNLVKKEKELEMPTNQSILVSGESGAGKTVTTKIVLNYFAMLSRKKSEVFKDPSSFMSEEKASIEQQVLQSNPILEAFGNARTMRNDNSSRFGKYINIAFTSQGKLLRASIDTYLLEKVRLIHQSSGERNFHIFYQFLESASSTEREELCLNNFTPEDFALTNQSQVYDRRDGIQDVDMHTEMVEAMNVMNFGEETVEQLMRLVVAILFAGNMKFVSDDGSSSFSESCLLEEDEASLAVAKLLGVSFDKLAASLTTKVLFARGDIIHKGLDANQAEKANEALIKSIYGAAFDFITEKINLSINAGSDEVNGGATSNGGRPSLRKSVSGISSVGASIVPPGGASIGVLGQFLLICIVRLF
jgi:myosin heavy subunit